MEILIADDQPDVRSALRLLLQQATDMTIVGEVATAGELLNWLSSNSADLVLLDWELPGQLKNGIIPAIRSIRPDITVIATDSHPQSRREAMAQGADDFVVKGEPPKHLLEVMNCGWSAGCCRNEPG